MMTLAVLAVDHYFEQDLDTLAEVERLSIRRIPYTRLRRPAMRMIGVEVAGDLDVYGRVELAEQRDRFARWLEREVERLYLEQPFDVVVLPSDALFYTRPLPDAAHRLGIPVVVVQKETAVAPGTSETDIRAIGEHVPFISDAMTVCSERAASHWLKAGAPPEAITVTGQPRFGVYGRARARRDHDRGHVLFLSYQLDAYIPGTGNGLGLPVWQALRTMTEETLIAHARSTGRTLVIKPHPQQPWQGEADRIRALAGDLWGRSVHIADPVSDTRRLILDSSVVVGFQSTALLEAAASGATTIYAAWGASFEEIRGQLLPLDRAPGGCILHAGDADELASMLATSAPRSDEERCREWIEEAIGPYDGAAAERVADVLERVVGQWSATPRRAELDRRRRRFAAAYLGRSLAAEALWTAAGPVAGALGRRRGVDYRRLDARQHRRLAVNGLVRNR